MASGAQDYWASSTNKMSAMLDSILAGLLTGSDMLNALGAIDMSAVEAALKTGGDLMTRLEAFSTSDIVTALSAGSALVNLLDAIDGSLDGNLTLSNLNSAECLVLAKLVGIDASLLTGSDLINKLDALDGTMDGKLTLSELNVSTVANTLDLSLTELGNSVTLLNASLLKLDTQIARLGNIKDNTSPLIVTDVTVFSETHEGGERILAAGVFPNRKNIRVYNYTSSHEEIYVGYTDTVNHITYEYRVEKGERVDISSTTTIYIYMYHAGTFYFKTWDTG